MIELENIPNLRGERPAGAPVVKRKAATQLAGGRRGGPDRRTVLRGAVVGITTLGFSALGAFPTARRAYADGYNIYPYCPWYASGHDCSPGCGPSNVNNSACASSGYHRNNYAGNNIWYSLRPNACETGGYDGWIWRYNGSCDGCRWIEFRCHDGWITQCFEQCWSVPNICRWITGCG